MRILMFVLISSAMFFYDVFGQCLVDQRTLLLQIQRNLTYDSLTSTKLVQWNESVDCCQWSGVSCNEKGNIIGLDLSYEPITGGFDESLLEKLSWLSVIRLDGVNFSAPFPGIFAGFENLTELSLTGCYFTGNVPGKVFQVPTLRSIDLSFNEKLGGSLLEFPENGGSLERLNLEQTMFSGKLPESIGNLRALSYVNLVHCNFSGPIPGSVGNLTSLVELRLGRNRFNGSIPSFELSKNLTFIDLSENRLTGEIGSSHWADLENLESLNLNNNSFSGHVPSSLFLLPSLGSLDLSSNRFSGQITDLQNVRSPLGYLDLSSNGFEGPIPSFFFQLQNLTMLKLSSNRFNGTVYLTKFRYPESISSLDLSDNRLVVETKITEEELPLLPQLGSLTLSSCNLQTVPNFLQNQSEMSMLDLSKNNISGEIPTWIWTNNDGFLRNLNLSNNRFTHMQEPKEYGFHDYFDLHSNMLSGKIPRLPRAAVYLDLSSNNFSSSIPPDIGDRLPNVRFFSIANNRVNGTIPPSWCHATNLEILDLSDNTLQGTIPSCLAHNNTNLNVLKHYRCSKLNISTKSIIKI